MWLTRFAIPTEAFESDASLFLYAKYSVHDTIISANNYIYYLFIGFFLVLLCQSVSLHNLIAMTCLYDYSSDVFTLFAWFDSFAGFLIFLIGDAINSFSNMMCKYFNMLLVLRI